MFINLQLYSLMEAAAENANIILGDHVQRVAQEAERLHKEAEIGNTTFCNLLHDIIVGDREAVESYAEDMGLLVEGEWQV